MKRHTFMFIFCLRPMFFLCTNAQPPPELEQMKVPAERLSDMTGKVPEKRLSPDVNVTAPLEKSADDLTIGNNEAEYDIDDTDTLNDLQLEGTPGKKRSLLEEKPRSGLVKRRYLGVIKNLFEPESRDLRRQKQQAVYRGRRDNFNNLNNFILNNMLDTVVNEGSHSRRIEAELKNRLRHLGTYLNEQENQPELSNQTFPVNATTMDASITVGTSDY